MITLEQFESDWQWLITFVLAIGASVDLLLAVSLCFYLKKRRDSSFKRFFYTP